MSDVSIVMWTVYDHPSDFPDEFVARAFRVTRGQVEPTNITFTAPSLDEVRAMLPPGLYPLTRNVGDEPQIVEVWL